MEPVLLGCLLVAVVTGAPAANEKEIEFRMPGVQPQVKDTYFCYAMKMGEEPTYLTGYVPHGNMSTAHHILLFGCDQPGGENVWNCGEMQSADDHSQSGPVCMGGQQIVYAWAMDAPMLKLPEGVGYKVGGDTPVQYLVLQIHYKEVAQFIAPNNNKDNSGLTLLTTSVPQPRRAGVYLLATGGTIPAHSVTYMEAACSIEDDVKLHPFAFRVHAHKHGKVISGYRVRDGEWKEIGRQSPQKPQMFYNVSHPGMVVEKGDVVAARCTMVDEDDEAVDIGSTQKDEMCNFYMMYYVDGDKVLDEQYCQKAGPPHWYWTDMESINAENAPADASLVPETGKILKATKAAIAATEEDMENMTEDLDEEFEQLLANIGDNYMPEQYAQERMMVYPDDDEQFAPYIRDTRPYENEVSDEEMEDYYDQMRRWIEERYE